MVSTRNHPSSFSKISQDAGVSLPPPKTWAHTPSNITVIWLLISIPLVMWDTGYLILRPHSMPGGKYHYPIWSLYETYCRVDHVYGWPAYESGDGFPLAQGSLNIVETCMYLYYLYIVWAYNSNKDIAD